MSIGRRVQTECYTCGGFCDSSDVTFPLCDKGRARFLTYTHHKTRRCDNKLLESLYVYHLHAASPLFQLLKLTQMVLNDGNTCNSWLFSLKQIHVSCVLALRNVFVLFSTLLGKDCCPTHPTVTRVTDAKHWSKIFLAGAKENSLILFCSRGVLYHVSVFLPKLTLHFVPASHLWVHKASFCVTLRKFYSLELAYNYL